MKKSAKKTNRIYVEIDYPVGAVFYIQGIKPIKGKRKNGIDMKRTKKLHAYLRRELRKYGPWKAPHGVTDFVVEGVIQGDGYEYWEIGS